MEDAGTKQSGDEVVWCIDADEGGGATSWPSDGSRGGGDGVEEMMRGEEDGRRRTGEEAVFGWGK